MTDCVMVSILCATYNHERYIAQAIESFLIQKTSFPIEIIIHDDASTDGTAAIVRSYADRYPDKVVAILQTQNQHSRGVKIMEIMLNAARGKYAAVCEGDDYWAAPDKLEIQTRYMEAHPDCSLCLHAAYYVDANGKRIGLCQSFERDRIVDMPEIIAGGGKLAATSSYMYPMALRKRTMPDFFRECVGVGDNPLQLFLASTGYVYYFREPMSCYRRGHPGSWTVNVFRQDERLRSEHLTSSIKMLRAFDEYSGFRWHVALEAVIARKQLEILQADHDYRAIFSPPHRKTFLKLPIDRRCCILAKYALYKISPRLYRRYLSNRKIV